MSEAQAHLSRAQPRDILCVLGTLIRRRNCKMLLLKLNFEMMSRPTLMAYHRELCEIARDAMSSEERQRYRAVRERVATLLAFPR